MQKSLLLASLLLLFSCKAPNEAFFNRGEPESLLDVSSEVVNLPVATSAQVNELSSWVNRDQPTRAELYCRASDPHCQDAAQVLELFDIPTLKVPSGQSAITLVYERTLARDCEARYIDNRHNQRNLSHPTFGCATAANIVQHVSDKQQFVNPALSSPGDAAKAAQVIDRYNAPPPEQDANTVTKGITGAIEQ
jgi:hypothetical protein